MRWTEKDSERPREQGKDRLEDVEIVLSNEKKHREREGRESGDGRVIGRDWRGQSKRVEIEIERE